MEDLQSIMAQSSATGSDRIKELQNLLAMLKADTQQIKMNAEQSRKLKRVLHKALDARWVRWHYNNQMETSDNLRNEPIFEHFFS